jgi:hypothetical protein
MGDAGQQNPLEVLEDPRERLAGGRRRCRQLPGDRPRLDLGPHRIALDALEVVRHPVDQPMGVLAKLDRIHRHPSRSSWPRRLARLHF